MEIGQSLTARNAPSRPALTSLIAAMAKLSRRKRLEIALLGRKASAAKAPRIRRLTREVTAEARRLAREAAQ
jgi:hypothetical protein